MRAITDGAPRGAAPAPRRVESTLGSALAAQGQLVEAEKLLLAGSARLRGIRSTPPPRLRLAVERLVAFHVANGESDEAASWRRRLEDFDSSRS